MKRMAGLLALLLALLVFHLPVAAMAESEAEDFSDSMDIDAQLDALGKDELLDAVPDEARALMEEIDLDDLKLDALLQLSPKSFFKTLWQVLVQQVKKPLRTLGIIAGVAVLCALLGGLQSAMTQGALQQVFSVVAVLSVLTSVIMPIIDCIIDTSRAVQDVSTFMLSFIPVFSASMVAAGQPVTGATYNLFLFSTCQVVSQVVAQTLIPLMGIYLALCVVGAVVPEIRIDSTANTIKSIVSWALGLLVTVFVGLLSIQTLVTGGADSVSSRAARFLIGSFVPVVGGALSEAFTAAQGCLRLIRTSVGAYGIIVAVFIFLPALIQTLMWYVVTNLTAVVSDLLGVDKISAVMRSCSSVLGILIAIMLCFALLIIVSTTVVLVVGLGA